MTRTEIRNTRWAAVAVAVAPAVMLAGFVLHPYFTKLPDATRVAEEVAAGTTRWGIAHLTHAVGSGLMILVFLAIRGYLRRAGEERYSTFGLPFVVLGSVLYAVLPGMEFAPLAAAQTGGDPEAVQVALDPWFRPVLATGVLLFAVGVYGFARGIAHSRVLGRGLTGVVVGGLVVMAAARLVPLGAVQFYLQGVAGLVGLWPLAYEMWRRPAPEEKVEGTQSLAVA